MRGQHEGRGVRLDDLRRRLHDLGRKARRQPKALTLEEIDEICTLVAKLKPKHDILGRGSADPGV